MAAAALLLLAAAPAAALTQAVKQGLVGVDDARLFYEVVGRGDPVVVVHGGPGLDHAYLRPGLDVLAPTASLIYFDQRGTGRSEAALDSSTITLDAFVRDIDALRQALGHERVTLLAHSFGGLIALAYARAHPAHTRALILVASVEPGRRWAAASAERLRRARSPADSAEMADLAASPGFAARDAGTFSRYYRAAYRATMRDPALLDLVDLDLAGRTARNGPDVARLLGTSMGEVDWWEELPGLDVPTLILHGRSDPTPVAMARALEEALPDARLTLLDAGHFPWVEDGQALVRAVTTFLAGLRR